MTELFLIASLDGHDIAVEACRIDAVVDIATILPVPRTDPAIRGLVALRSRVATVIDTRRLLGLDPAPEAMRRAVTMLVDGHLYAFLVDTLADVAPFERLPLPAGIALGTGWRPAAMGIVEQHGRPILIVDLAALVGSAAALAA